MTGKSSSTKRPIVAAPLIRGGFIAAVAWANFLAYRFAHFNLFASPHAMETVDSFQAGLYLFLAALASLLGLGGGWMVARNDTKLIDNGIPVVGKICGLAPIRFKGLRSCSIEYQIDGKIHVHEPILGHPVHLDGINLGDPVELYVDPIRPQSVCLVWPSRA